MADTSRARFDVSLLEQARVGSAVGREVGVLHGVKALDERLVSESPHADREAAARPSLIPSLCTHCTRAGIEWRRRQHAVYMARPYKEPHHSAQAGP